MINAEVTKVGSENPLSTIRKFTRRVQGTGLVRTVRGKRYFERAMSQSVKKKKALKRIDRRKAFYQNVKEGKVAAPEARRQHTPRENTSTKLGEGTPIAR